MSSGASPVGERQGSLPEVVVVILEVCKARAELNRLVGELYYYCMWSMTIDDLEIKWVNAANGQSVGCVIERSGTRGRTEGGIQ
jgi:hypothetical protein